jgi:hypothetical protein
VDCSCVEAAESSDYIRPSGSTAKKMAVTLRNESSATSTTPLSMAKTSPESLPTICRTSAAISVRGASRTPARGPSTSPLDDQFAS